jgi:hypothetical protein
MKNSGSKHKQKMHVAVTNVSQIYRNEGNSKHIKHDITNAHNKLPVHINCPNSHVYFLFVALLLYVSLLAVIISSAHMYGSFGICFLSTKTT